MNTSDLFYQCPICEELLKDVDKFKIAGKEIQNKSCSNCSWSLKSEFINENDM